MNNYFPRFPFSYSSRYKPQNHYYQNSSNIKANSYFPKFQKNSIQKSEDYEIKSKKSLHDSDSLTEIKIGNIKIPFDDLIILLVIYTLYKENCEDKLIIYLLLFLLI